MLVLATLVLVAYALVIQDNPLSFLAATEAALSRYFTLADTHIHLGACTQPVPSLPFPPHCLGFFYMILYRYITRHTGKGRSTDCIHGMHRPFLRPGYCSTLVFFTERVPVNMLVGLLLWLHAREGCTNILLQSKRHDGTVTQSNVSLEAAAYTTLE